MNDQLIKEAVEPSAVRMLLSHYGVRVELAAVTSALTKAGQPQFSSGKQALRQLDAALASLGIGGAEYALTRVGAIESSHVPAVIWYDDACWVLLEIHGAMLILDSGAGDVRKVAMAEIQNAVAIWIKPRRSARAVNASRPALSLLFGGLLKQKRTIFEVAIATVLTSVLAIGTSLFAQQVYDKVVPSFAYATLWALAGIVSLLIFFDFCLRIVRSRLLDRVSTRIDETVSTEIFQALGDIRLDARPRAVGTLAAQISSLDTARNFFTSSVLFTIAEIPFAVLFVVVIGMIAGPIAWIYAVVAGLAVVIGLLVQFNVRRLAKQQIESGFHRNGLLIEAITGIETIKVLGAEWRFADRWRSLTEEISRLSLKSRSTLSVATSSAGALSSFAYVSVIVMGVNQIESGSLTVGGLIAATVLCGRVVGPIANGLNLLTQWHMASQSLRAVDSVLSLPRDHFTNAKLLYPQNLEQSVRVENLRFYFGEAPIPILEIPSISFAPGDRVLLLGPPGSGKSTLLRLLAGLYRPSSGQVSVGGIDMSMLDPECLRSMVSLLPQEIHLFKGTLKENLQLGALPDDNKLVDVMKLLGLDGLIADHPRGMDRPISEGGGGLSVGQKQLCGVARLLLRRPKIWLLDEPSSALDAATEKRLFNAIEAMLDPSDILIVATHRTAAVSFCQRIIMMQRGRVVEDGNRAELHERLRLQIKEKSTT